VLACITSREQIVLKTAVGFAARKRKHRKNKKEGGRRASSPVHIQGELTAGHSISKEVFGFALFGNLRGLRTALLRTIRSRKAREWIDFEVHLVMLCPT